MFPIPASSAGMGPGKPGKNYYSKRKLIVKSCATKKDRSLKKRAKRGATFCAPEGERIQNGNPDRDGRGDIFIKSISCNREEGVETTERLQR